MLYRKLVFLIILLSAAWSTSHAQRFQPQLSISAGGMQKVQSSLSERSLLPFLEVEVAAELLEFEESELTVFGALNVGGWRDHLAAEVSHCADCITHSYRAAAFGYRSYVVLEKFPVPAAVVMGVSRHVVFADYIGGAGVSGNPGSDHSMAMNFIELGARLYIPISRNLRVAADVLSLRRISSSIDRPHPVSARVGFSTIYQF